MQSPVQKRWRSPGINHTDRVCFHELADPDAYVAALFWTLFVAMAGLVLAWVVDPVTAQQVVGMITGMR